MRLLETTPSAIPQVREFIGSQIPPYAILSHTWGDDEVTLQQLLAADLPALQTQAGFDKIQETCALTRTRARLGYAWVDTCCIDKTSSAELSEAINSMFAWYRDAEVCYVFLADLKPGMPGDLRRDLPECRWFSRGWTLQELIAPRGVVFFDKEWNERGTLNDLAGLISNITGIPEKLLRHEAELCDFAVARRMSWAAARQTTRVEDMAYCLLGIFDVNLSLIYGEGIKAFARLQAAIVQTTADSSIFAWKDDRVPCPRFAGILAERPAQFAWCKEIKAAPGDSAYTNFAMTTRGIQTDASLLRNTFCRLDGVVIGIRVRQIGGGLYVRRRPDTVLRLTTDLVQSRPQLVETITFAMRLPTRFPFHPGPDPVVGNRCSALQVNWKSIILKERHVMPRSHWDEEQGVFFGCNHHTKGWCASFARGWIRNNATPWSSPIGLGLLLACFQWNTGPLTVVLASLDYVEAATYTLLQSQLDHIRFESYDGLKQETVLQTGFGPVRCLTDSRAWSRLMPGVQVKLTVRKELRPDVCVNPVIVVDVSCTGPSLP
ncbi:heterokaryon incompatibility protein-domain-containing protein [Parachaetomium inaequale]|uniref:Heterokaryon incompatibility protein-domain-containing protein n=1 Tax=Parachaetomium inaequale TaxID=2588326 RepID=A0AAN6PMR5_9PEZI|nr:heterokaryon incompatibility protein-domain-containing protein [Parachaetomium inaequale]